MESLRPAGAAAPSDAGVIAARRGDPRRCGRARHHRDPWASLGGVWVVRMREPEAGASLCAKWPCRAFSLPSLSPATFCAALLLARKCAREIIGGAFA